VLILVSGSKKVVLSSGYPHRDNCLIKLMAPWLSSMQCTLVNYVIQIYKWKQHFYANVWFLRLNISCMKGFGLWFQNPMW